MIANVKSASLFLLGLFGSQSALIFLSPRIVCKMKWKEKEMSHCSGELSKTVYKVFSKEFTTNQIRMPIIPRCRWLKPGGLRLGG